MTYGTTTSNYNPPADPGGAAGRRWGDYSFTVVDPIDDMSVWTIQEYNQASNSYAVRVGCLTAPLPATPTCSGSPIIFTGPTGNVVINATSSGGSGFYDPGANLAPPALPFSHISATVTNATVNSVTFNNPTQVTLNITALTPGLQNVTITNPDGQSVTANGCINVQAAAVADLGITKTDGVATAVPGGSVTYTITASNASATAGDRRHGGGHLPGGAHLHVDLRRRGRRHLHGLGLGQHQRHRQPPRGRQRHLHRDAAPSPLRRPAR